MNFSVLVFTNWSRSQFTSVHGIQVICLILKSFVHKKKKKFCSASVAQYLSIDTWTKRSLVWEFMGFVNSVLHYLVSLLSSCHMSLRAWPLWPVDIFLFWPPPSKGYTCLALCLAMPSSQSSFLCLFFLWEMVKQGFSFLFFISQRMHVHLAARLVDCGSKCNESKHLI